MKKECTKIKFETAELADAEIRRIVENTNFSPWKDIKPSRKFLCPYCKNYHLTSKPFITEYKKTP